MSKTFEGAVKMTASRPGQLPQHYESDLVIRNYEETIAAAEKLCDAVAKAQEAAKELRRLLETVKIDFTDDMTLVIDDGRVFEHIDHAYSLNKAIEKAVR